MMREKSILTLSAAAAVVFALAGTIVGLLTASQVILFDGLYSFISVGLSLLSVGAAAFKQKEDTRRYPFGKTMVDPLVVLIKYSVIALLVAGSMAAAIYALFTGGRDTALGGALVYAVFGALTCAVAYSLFLKGTRRKTTPLLEAEKNQWLMDALISGGVVLGFFAAFVFSLLETTAALVPYTDPVLMLLMTAYFLPVPVREIRRAVAQLLEQRPDGGESEAVEDAIHRAVADEPIDESIIRLAHVGSTLWVEMDIIVTDPVRLQRLSEQDELRRRIAGVLPEEDVWLTISFTADRKWAL
ncbi:cation diffusion facilitator family transporter [Alkalicoccus urumqiensis]|nr:cation transporter [Alkalicoccus urumqiensis]